MNPYANLDVKLRGDAPFARIENIKSKDSDLNRVTFTVDKKENLSIGHNGFSKVDQLDTSSDEITNTDLFE